MHQAYSYKNVTRHYVSLCIKCLDDGLLITAAAAASARRNELFRISARTHVRTYYGMILRRTSLNLVHLVSE